MVSSVLIRAEEVMGGGGLISASNVVRLIAHTMFTDCAKRNNRLMLCDYSFAGIDNVALKPPSARFTSSIRPFKRMAIVLTMVSPKPAPCAVPRL